MEMIPERGANSVKALHNYFILVNDVHCVEYINPKGLGVVLRGIFHVTAARMFSAAFFELQLLTTWKVNESNDGRVCDKMAEFREGGIMKTAKNFGKDLI